MLLHVHVLAFLYPSRASTAISVDSLARDVADGGDVSGVTSVHRSSCGDLSRLFPDCDLCRSAAQCRSDVELRHLTENNFYSVVLARLESASLAGSETETSAPVLRMYTNARDDTVSLYSAPRSRSISGIRKLPRLVRTFIGERRDAANQTTAPATSSVAWHGFPGIESASCGSANGTHRRVLS